MITCPVCSKELKPIASGKIKVHGPRDNRCPGSGQTPGEAIEQALTPEETISAAYAGYEKAEAEKNGKVVDFASWVPKDPKLAAEKAANAEKMRRARCERCNHDRHRCQGCGAPVDHTDGADICDDCDLGLAQNGLGPEDLQQPVTVVREPARPAFTGRQRLDSLGADIVLGQREVAAQAIQFLRDQPAGATLAVDIETEGLGLLARNIKVVIISDGRTAALYDPRDPVQMKLVNWLIEHAKWLLFHNSPYDVPNMAINGMFTVDACAKVIDTMLYARLAEPANTVPKSLGACANRYLGLQIDEKGMRESAKAVGIRSEKQMYREFDLDRPVWVRGAATDAIVTHRLLTPLRKAALTRLMTGHPFEEWGVRGHDALHLLEREQVLNRMSLRRSVKGLRVDLEFNDRFVAQYGQQIDGWERELTEAGVRPTVAPDLIKKMEELGALPPGYPRTGKTKILSGKKEHIETINHPLAKLFLEHKEAIHVQRDYLEKVADISVPHPDGSLRIHPVIKYFGATTGRMSVGDPPLQQFPGPARGVIMADAGDNLTSIDWSQIEPVVIANIAGQTDVLEGYESGREDFYDTLARVTGLPRKQNKTQLLGTLYGQGKKLTAAKLGVDLAKAEEIRNAVFAPMPKVLQLTKDLRQIAETYEMVPTVSGRIVPVSSGWYTDPETGERRWSVHTHKGVNYHVQGSAYDVLAESAYACEMAGLGDAIYLLMHDEVVCSTEAAHDIRKIMTTPPQRLIDRAKRVPVLRTDMLDLGERWNVA